MKKIIKQKKLLLDTLMKETIINGAIKLIREKGIKTLTMDNIANEVKIAKGTIYLYFKNREDLIKAIIQKIKEPFVIQFDKIKNSNLSIQKKIEKILTFALSDIEKNLMFVRIIMQYVEASPSLKRFLFNDWQRLIEFFAELFKDAIKKGEIKMKNPEYVSKLITACMNYMIYERGMGYIKCLPVKKEVELFMNVFNLGYEKIKEDKTIEK
ncbi:MAG TPA: TetR/AcrR family transcriptional regulator [bacterium]|nr:TetR/AcrR family transcriptional regulator [bacterium]HOL48018.1 TetR/AcrR family transcriptional regulator [bacterium]HPQ19566.1 TetR/AcrR family transcriptional regulator [bacterium]